MVSVLFCLQKDRTMQRLLIFFLITLSWVLTVGAGLGFATGADCHTPAHVEKSIEEPHGRSFTKQTQAAACFCHRSIIFRDGGATDSHKHSGCCLYSDCKPFAITQYAISPNNSVKTQIKFPLTYLVHAIYSHPVEKIENFDQRGPPQCSVVPIFLHFCSFII